MFDNEGSPSISISFDNTRIKQFQALSPGGDHRRHGVAKGMIVVNVNPKTMMIREGTKAKFKVSFNGDINGWRSKDTINRVRASIEGCRRMGAMV